MAVEKPRLTVKCDECERVFDLLDPQDVDDYFYDLGVTLDQRLERWPRPPLGYYSNQVMARGSLLTKC